MFAFSVAALSGAAGDASADALTWNGLTLYGALDIGYAHQTHGAPLSDDWMVGVQYLILKSGNGPISSVAPNGLSQSKLGLKGFEPINDDLAFVFNLETGFNPQSGKLSDALESLAHNNGRALAEQESAGDGSRAGQWLNGEAFLGLSSAHLGTLTYGRHNTILLDNIVKFDPLGGSYAFSVIGFSGTTAGMGDTQDTRLDESLKYVYTKDAFHVGALYQPGYLESSPGVAWQLDLGYEHAGFDIEAVYGQKKDAIAASSLNAEQVASLPADSLAATVSDNASYTLDASYAIGAFKAFAGYERIRYENPSRPLEPGFSGLGGHFISIVNNAPFPRPKIFHVSWGGVQYAATASLVVTGAFYRYDQDSYGTHDCSDASAASCSGSLDAYSLVADYHLTKALDVYTGAMYSRVADGLAAGYLHTSNVNVMTGFRFKF